MKTALLCLAAVITFASGLAVGWFLVGLKDIPKAADGHKSGFLRPRWEPFIDSDIVPSSMLSMLGPHADETDQVLHSVIFRALSMTEQETAEIRRCMRAFLSRLAYSAEARTAGDHVWEIIFSEGNVKSALKDLAEATDGILGSERSYLFLVLMQQDIRMLVLNRNLAIRKGDGEIWEVLTSPHPSYYGGGQISSFDLDRVKRDTPIAVMVAKCK